MSVTVKIDDTWNSDDRTAFENGIREWGSLSISSADSIFGSLRLWQNTNHNGVSEPGGLRTLPALGVVRLDLDYKESRRTDQHGNVFRYRAKVYGVAISLDAGPTTCFSFLDASN